MLFPAYYYCIFALILNLYLEKKFDKLELLGSKGGTWMRQNSDWQTATWITRGEKSVMQKKFGGGGCCSVTKSFSCSVVSDSLWPHGMQHARFPCPSPPPRACSKSCPLSQWCHPTISSFVIPFFYPQSFPASGSFPMSWLFTSGGQSTGASASASVLPMNIQDLFPLGLTGLISLLSKGRSRFLRLVMLIPPSTLILCQVM